MARAAIDSRLGAYPAILHEQREIPRERRAIDRHPVSQGAGRSSSDCVEKHQQIELRAPEATRTEGSIKASRRTPIRLAQRETQARLRFGKPNFPPGHLCEDGDQGVRNLAPPLAGTLGRNNVPMSRRIRKRGVAPLPSANRRFTGPMTRTTVPAS